MVECMQSEQHRKLRGCCCAQVITLADVNIVNLERVGFGLRNFDMAVVPKARAHIRF